MQARYINGVLADPLPQVHPAIVGEIGLMPKGEIFFAAMRTSVRQVTCVLLHVWGRNVSQVLGSINTGSLCWR